MAKTRDKYNRHDLLKELNRLKIQEFGEHACPITRKQVFLYCNPKNTQVKRYRTFNIKKKNGGTREISAPYRTLHSIQTALNAYFKELYVPSDSAMGFVPGRSVVDNAGVHIGHNYVLNMDLKNFFPSISEGRVIARLQLPPFGFNKEIAQVLGGICAILVEEEGKENFVLPQGAPTSPLLTNAVCDSLDRKLRKLAYKYGLHYSRYADDMTFSSMHNVYQKDGDFMREVRKTIEDEGFTINESKTRLQKRGRRQEVTGLTVNEKVNVARQYVHELRCILHIWETYGYADAYARFYPKYKKEKGYIKKGEPVLENVIDGKLNYLKMVKGKDDKVLQKLFARYMALSPCIYSDKETDKGYQYVFVQSYTVEEFEKRFDTKILLKNSEKNTIIGFCEMFGRDKYVSVSKKTQEWLRDQSTLTTNKDGDSYVANALLPLCHITLCRQRAKNFWLLTQNEPKKTAIVKLNYQNVPLDDLLQVWDKDGLEAAADLFHKYCIGDVDTEQEKPKEKKKKKSGFFNFVDVSFDIESLVDIDELGVDSWDDLEIDDSISLGTIDLL